MVLQTSVDFHIKMLNTAAFLRSPRQFLIDTNLNGIKKAGFCWRVRYVLLSVLQPFYQLCGRDAFSHLRVNEVASAVLRLCQQNQETLRNNTRLAGAIRAEILEPLNQLTQGKYSSSVLRVTEQIQQLATPLPAPSLPPRPQEEFHLPDDPGFYRNHDAREALRLVLTHLVPRLREDPHNCILDFTKDERGRCLNLIENVGSGERKRAVIRSFPVPLSFHIEYNSHVPTKIILLGKRVITWSGQTRIRSCFDIFGNCYVVKKRCTDPVHIWAVRYFHAHPLPGIVPVIGVRESVHKTQFFEPLFPGSLLGALRAIRPENVIEIIRQLLLGLAHLHKLQYLENSLLGPVPFAHRDLKPENILYDPAKNSAVITDFGSATPLNGINTPLYIPPEFYPTDRSDRAVAKRIQQGQQGDVWSMGLVCVTLLAGKTYTDRQVSCAPLLCLETMLFEANQQFYQLSREEQNRQGLSQLFTFVETRLPAISQATLDENFRQRQESPNLLPNNHPHSQDLWNLARQMVRANPNERITALTALRSLNRIVPTLDPKFVMAP